MFRHADGSVRRLFRRRPARPLTRDGAVTARRPKSRSLATRSTTGLAIALLRLGTKTRARCATIWYWSTG
jgi:hypothetical protein